MSFSSTIKQTFYERPINCLFHPHLHNPILLSSNPTNNPISITSHHLTATMYHLSHVIRRGSSNPTWSSCRHTTAGRYIQLFLLFLLFLLFMTFTRALWLWYTKRRKAAKEKIFSPSLALPRWKNDIVQGDQLTYVLLTVDGKMSVGEETLIRDRRGGCR